MFKHLEGGCLCGALRYRVSTSPIDSGYCHCRMCQRNTGAPVVAYVIFPDYGFIWTQGQPRLFASSTEGRRLFCGNCGTFVVFRHVDYPNEISVNTATLDDPSLAPPLRHIHVESKLPWFEIADDLPREQSRAVVLAG